MIVQCIQENIDKLPTKLHSFAFSQDATGKVDCTIGKRYVVYGTRDNEYGRFYLVLTDTLYTDLPWWMPAGLYEVVDETVPNDWVEHNDTAGKTFASNLYFGAEAEIEDGESQGIAVFSRMRVEPECDQSTKIEKQPED